MCLRSRKSTNIIKNHASTNAGLWVRTRKHVYRGDWSRRVLSALKSRRRWEKPAVISRSASFAVLAVPGLQSAELPAASIKGKTKEKRKNLHALSAFPGTTSTLGTTFLEVGISFLEMSPWERLWRRTGGCKFVIRLTARVLGNSLAGMFTTQK